MNVTENNSILTLFIIVFISIIFADCVWNLNSVFAQSYNQDTPSDSKNLIIKYCKQYADSVSKGIDVIQDLIGAGILPNSYHGQTCQDQTK
jgi:hypothetical protein